MATTKQIKNFLMWLSLIIVIMAGITFFYKQILLTIILLVVGAIAYIFKKDFAKIIKEVIG